MNIFYLDKNPATAAKVQYNKHVVKMILESAQMLCAAHHILGNPNDVPYKLAHKNHPCTIWVRENSLHYDWLYAHMIALGLQYTYRYGKVHKSIVKCIKRGFNVQNYIGAWDNVPQELMNDYKVEDNDIKIIKQIIYERRFNK